jgi:hypothetical protein
MCARFFVKAGEHSRKYFQCYWDHKTKPNANLIINFLNLKAEKLSKRDVIICGGTRDVTKDETKEG